MKRLIVYGWSNTSFFFCFHVDSQCFGNHFRVGANGPLRCLLQVNPKGRRRGEEDTRGSTLRDLITAPINFLIKEILLFVFCSFFFFFFFFLFLLSICPTLISKGIRWQQNKNEKGKQERRTEKEVELAYHVFNCHLVSCGVVGYVCFDFINVITIPQQGSRFTGECISKGLK